MAEYSFILVVYDISNDRRRTKLHNKLLDFGTPVQYSVFECLIPAEDLQLLKKAVYKVIRKRVDHVRFYRLCAACVKQTEVCAGREVLSADENSLIV